MLSKELNSFWSTENAETAQAIRELWLEVMAPMKSHYGMTLQGKPAQNALRTCFDMAEKLFADIASRHGIEFWFPVIRKRIEKFREHNAQTYCTLSLFKYASANDQSAIPLNETGESFEIGLLHTSQDFLDADRLIYLASLMDVIGGVYRWVGKGSELLPSEEFPILHRSSIEVQTAVWTYEQRRPVEAALRDQGVMRNVQSKGHSIHFIGIAIAKEKHFVVPEWKSSWPCLRLPVPFPADGWIQILESYREAIEDLHEAPLASLFHFLSGLCAQVVNNIPSFTVAESGDVQLAPRHGDDEQSWKRRASFLLGFTDKGYFRFPLARWLEMMVCIRSPWADNDVDSMRLNEEFFRGFALNEKRRAQIDVSTLRPMPFCFKTAANWIYVDVQGTGDFLANLVESAKDWFSSQHGDRFTLAVKRLIQSERPEVEIIGWKHDVAVPGKRSVECDLLLATQSAIWVVECKAFAKSAEFYRGDREAVQKRAQRLAEAFGQAKKQTAAIEQAMSNGDNSIPNRKRIETVVCTPSQEFLCPLNAFGFITGDVPDNCAPEELLRAFGAAGGIAKFIPRICTPEELVRALTLAP